MDRQIVYVGALARTRDVLFTNKNTMLALGMAMQAVIGTSRLVDGLDCTPTSPPSLTVNISPGSIYDYQVVDQAAYGILSADTDNFVVKQGISLSPLTFNCPAPATTGYSQNYLVQVALLEEDGGSTVLPFYNANSPSQPFNGPNNTGTSSNTIRQDLCAVSLKAGTAAATGSQTTPAADTGYTALWVITVANGQTAINTGDIVAAAGAPFIGDKLTARLAASNNLSDVASATTARNNLSAAKSGANTDITSLNAPAIGAATATTAASNDSSTKVATTAFANPANSKATNGYIKLASGVIIQWGQGATPSAGNGTTIVTFPVTFPTAAKSVVTCEGAATGWGGPPPTQPVIHGVSGIATTGFSAWTSKWTGSTFGATNATFNWIAVGY